MIPTYFHFDDRFEVSGALYFIRPLALRGKNNDFPQVHVPMGQV